MSKKKRALVVPKMPTTIEACFIALGTGCCVQLARRPSRRFDLACWYQLMLRIGPDNSTWRICGTTPILRWGQAFGVRAIDCVPSDPAWALSPDSFLWMLHGNEVVVACELPIRGADLRGAVKDPVQ